jgi:hypothetical protein
LYLTAGIQDDMGRLDPAFICLFGSVVVVAFFGCVAFGIWMDACKKKAEANHRERLRALELGHPPQHAEIERANTYSHAAWAAGLIGLLVPLTVLALTAGGAVAIVVLEPMQANCIPLIVAWSLAAILVLVTVVRSLNVIRHLPRPTPESTPRVGTPDKQATNTLPEYHVISSEMLGSEQSSLPRK